MDDTGHLDDGRTTRERMLAGDLYIADDPELAAMAQRARGLEAALDAAFAYAEKVRTGLAGRLDWQATARALAAAVDRAADAAPARDASPPSPV